MQMPTVWIALQDAPAPHWASPARRALTCVDGEQMSAHFLSVPVLALRAHCGLAVTLAGTLEEEGGGRTEGGREGGRVHGGERGEEGQLEQKRKRGAKHACGQAERCAPSKMQSWTCTYSVGQAAEAQSGEQKAPVTPVIWTACSSDMQPFGVGFS